MTHFYRFLCFLFFIVLAALGCNQRAETQTRDGGRSSSKVAESVSQTEVVKLDTTLAFLSGDSLEVTADVRIAHEKTAPFIMLFHQAGWSRGEYQEIIPRLVNLGFNCMAIDQRSGDGVNGAKNQTHQRATAAGKSTTYLDAYQDLEAAVRFAKTNYAQGKLIAWGSSYSAALVIKLASQHDDVVDGVLSFAPGEYFGRLGAGKDYVTKAARTLKCPVFVTSARKEKANWFAFYKEIPTAQKRFFIPETAGNHGSRALWAKFSDSGAYWQAVEAFLTENFVGRRNL